MKNCDMTKVLNVITNGINREGISTSYLECMKHFDFSECQVDIASVYEDDNEQVIEEFKYVGCSVYRFSDRNTNLIKYIACLYRHMRKENYDVIHVHGSSSRM